MSQNIIEFLSHWGVTALSLWLTSFIFHGISFTNKKSLFVSALLLGLANAVIRPIIVILTIPLTLITFGLFLLVINALMMLLVSALVPGFRLSGFWTAFFASIVVTLLSLIAGTFIFQSDDYPMEVPVNRGVLI
ncbi:MAG: phage holin family protein [Nitrosospira sp.]|nr:phage holin family protein [Nitrosospira sp.]